jgi:hypothetical protein
VLAHQIKVRVAEGEHQEALSWLILCWCCVLPAVLHQRAHLADGAARSRGGLPLVSDVKGVVSSPKPAALLKQALFLFACAQLLVLVYLLGVFFLAVVCPFWLLWVQRYKK